MKKDDELWLKKMKEMLDDYTEPSPAGGWERLEKEISPPVSRRMLFYRICTGVAAAIFLAVGGVGVYLMNSPATDDIRNVAVTKMNSVPDNLPLIPEQGNASAQIEPVGEISGKTFIAQVKKTNRQTEENNSVVENIPETKEIEAGKAGKENIPVENTEAGKDTNPVVEDSSGKPTRPSGKDKLHLPVGRNKSKSSEGKWSMALSVNSGAGNSLSDDNGYQPILQGMQMNQFATIGQASSPDYLDIRDKDLVFNNGMPYTKQAESLSYDHKQPITVGLSVRKKLAGNFSVETGLTYTYLLSDVYKQGEKQTKLGEQKLHYIGIPLRVNWNFLDTDKFTLYLTAGGALEKWVYGKTVDESEAVKSKTVKQLQASVVGGVGAQFNITRKVGIYAEPGVAYFFKNGSDVETIRKENPFNINLHAGIRLTY